MPAFTLLSFITGLSVGWIIAGGVALAAPLIAHFLSRHRGLRAHFPAVRFVRQAIAAQARRYRLRDALLLLLRVLIVALIALAFDRPRWTTRPSTGTDDTGVDLVVILDRSASMNRTERGRTLFDSARDQALTLVRSIDPARDRAAVIFAGLNPASALPRLSANIEALAGALEAASPTFECADFSGALALASTIPSGDDQSQGAGRARRVVVFADLQRTAWSSVSAPPGLRVEVRPIGPSLTTPNLAVVDVAVSPPRPIAGQPALVTVTLACSGDAPRVREVSLSGPRLPTQSAMPSIPADGRTTVTFETVFHDPGVVPVTASLIDESFTVDDARSIVVHVRKAFRVGIISARPSADALHHTYYAHTALCPGDDAIFAPTPLPPTGLTPDALTGLDGLVISDAGAIDDRSLRSILRYLADGGGALWFIDSAQAQDAAARFEALDPSDTILPTTGSARFTATSTPLRLGEGDFRSPALRTMDGPAAASLLRASFTAISPATLNPSGVALLSFDTSEPFAAWSQAGLGRLVLVHADLSPDHSTLVKSPLYPVLLYEFMRFIAPSVALEKPALIGQRPAARVDAQTTLREPLADDTGAPVTLTRVLTASNASAAPNAPSPSADALSGVDVILTGAPATTPGVRTINDADGNPITAVAAAIDARESDMRCIDAATLERVLGAGASASIADPQSDAAQATLRPTGVELWPALVCAALALLGVEALVALLSARGRATVPEAAA